MEMEPRGWEVRKVERVAWRVRARRVAEVEVAVAL